MPTLNQALAEKQKAVMAKRHRKPRTETGTAFDIPERLIPKDMSVQWGNETILGASTKEIDPNQVLSDTTMAEQGWEPAPVEPFKEILPPGYKDTVVRRGGMVLLMRPKYMTDEAREEDIQIARDQISQKLRQNGQTGNGELGRKVLKSKRSFEPISVDE